MTGRQPHDLVFGQYEIGVKPQNTSVAAVAENPLRRSMSLTIEEEYS